MWPRVKVKWPQISNSQKFSLTKIKGQVENNEAKVWQNGHEGWKKMQLDVGSEPPFGFACIKYIDKEIDGHTKTH